MLEFNLEEALLALKIDRPKLKRRTITLYESRFRSIAKLTNTEGIQFLDLEPEKVVGAILSSSYSLSTKKAFLGCLSVISKSICDKYHWRFYHEAFEELRAVLDNQTKQNKCSLKQFTNWLSLDAVRKFIRNRISEKGILKGEWAEMLLLALFSFLPARRATDYSLMKFVTASSQTESLDFNYLVFNPDSRAVELIFNQYKTSSIYGQQTFSISCSMIKTLISECFRRRYLIPNGPLIPKANFEFYKFYEMSKILTSVIRKNPDWKEKQANPTLFRTLWATTELNKGISYKQMETLATKMGTSVQMLLVFYRKIDPPKT